jgi:hypothetical protein
MEVGEVTTLLAIPCVPSISTLKNGAGGPDDPPIVRVSEEN